MGKVLSEIGPAEERFIAAQHIFFVATAPLSADHHVSLSPKACDGTAIAVIDPHTVCYADLTGSGAETAAHVQQNGRMTLMFCNIEEGPPKILRLMGQARVIPADSKEIDSYRKRFSPNLTESFGFRAVFELIVTRISTSCGYSLPVMEFRKMRSILDEYVAKKGKEGMNQYVTKKNSYSIDGLPSIGLMRKNAPNVVPYQEDGYVYGKVLDKSDDKQQKITWDVAIHTRKQRRVSRFWPVVQQIGVVAVTFLAGIVVGQTLQSRSNQRG